MPQSAWGELVELIEPIRLPDLRHLSYLKADKIWEEPQTLKRDLVGQEGQEYSTQKIYAALKDGFTDASLGYGLV